MVDKKIKDCVVSELETALANVRDAIEMCERKEVPTAVTHWKKVYVEIVLLIEEYEKR